MDRRPLGIAVGPLGVVSITLVILQPVLFDAFCTLCLVSAVISLAMIPFAVAEVLASLQHLKRVRREGGSLWRAFWGPKWAQSSMRSCVRCRSPTRGARNCGACSSSRSKEMGAVGILGRIALVWAASGMMCAVRTALNRAWQVDDARPWSVGKAVDVLLVFDVALLVATSVALNVTVRLAQRAVDLIGIGTTLAQVALGVLVPFVLVLLVTATAYRVVPAAESQLRDVVPAAALDPAVFTVGQFMFSLYLDHFGRYNAIYGSFGAIIALMFFVYLVALVFLAGAHVAALVPVAREEVRRPTADDEGQSSPMTIRMKRTLLGLVVASPPGATERTSFAAARPTETRPTDMPACSATLR